MRGRARELEDVPELMQDIQSRLPLEQAARTSLLSKSWLHAWSTISTLRLIRVLNQQDQDIKSMKLVEVDRTLTRYLNDNIPIEKFYLFIEIENQESASLVEKWIRSVVTKTCLKEFSLHGAAFTLPDEILSGENLTNIRVLNWRRSHSVWMTPPRAMINCASTLRELHLDGVCISEETLHDILSSCTLLVTLDLFHSCVGFKTIKVKNLPRLYELRITLDSGSGERYQRSTALEISDVPNLGVSLHFPFKHHSISSYGSSVTKLGFGTSVITDNACLDLIKSGFPFLEYLNLNDMSSWKLKSFHFTCASIKSLTLELCPRKLNDVQIHAPNLLFFWFDGPTLPILLFPVSTLEQITVSLRLDLFVVDDVVYFFLKMRETFALSRKCDVRITISNCDLPWDIDINELRTRLLFPPATNVQQLRFETWEDEGLWERSLFFDALFEICHPKYVDAKPDMRFRHNNHFCRVMLREVVEKKTTTTTTPCWTCHLKHVQIRQDSRHMWEILTNSHSSLLDGSAPDVFMHFKLMWR